MSSIPRWANHCLVGLLALSLLAWGHFIAYLGFTVQGALELELSRKGPMHPCMALVGLHALATAFACALASPKPIWGGLGSALGFLAGSVAVLFALEASFQANFELVCDETTVFWWLPLVGLQIAWLVVGGWFTWRLGRA